MMDYLISITPIADKIEEVFDEYKISNVYESTSTLAQFVSECCFHGPFFEEMAINPFTPIYEMNSIWEQRKDIRGKLMFVAENIFSVVPFFEYRFSAEYVLSPFLIDDYTYTITVLKNQRR